MKSALIFPVASALLFAGALGVPTVGHKHAALHEQHHRHKRADAIVWVTEFEVDIVTVIETVYGNGAAASQSTSAPEIDTPAPVTVTSYLPTTSSAVLSANNNNDYQSPAAPVTTTSSTTSTLSTTSSSIYVAPPAPTTIAAATTSAYVAPPPTTTSAYVAPAPATSAASPAASSSPGDGSTSAGSSYTGDFTWYDPGLGSCGTTSSATDAIVAISHTLFDPQTPAGNPNNNPLCGRTVKLMGKDGTTYSATVVDRCVGCAEGDLDLTSSLFNTVTSNGDGRVSGMSWSWS